MPNASDLDMQGLDIPPETLEELLKVDVNAWREELTSLETELSQYGARLPAALQTELSEALKRL